MNSNRYKILLIEDEANIRRFLKALLEANGYQILSAGTCSEGLLLYSHQPDLVILDLGLPDRDGTEFIQSVRQQFSTPILVLSARTEEADKVEALDLGANDYVTKPFGSAELLARIRSILRNFRHSSDLGRLPDGSFTCADLTIDYAARQVFLGGKEIHLTQTEYNILSLLSEHPGKVMTYAAIISHIWGVSDSGSIKKLQVNIANIRRKLLIRPGDCKYFLNELGIGYRMLSDE